MVSTKEMSAHKMVVKIEGETSLQNLAGKMSLKATDVLMRLLSMGMTGVNINSTLDLDTAKLLANEFNWSVEDVSIDEESSLEAAMSMEADGEELGEAVIRPPIVTVMGHVDHGKTTLLDHIRKTQVAAGEAGGITQHIGAYRVDTGKGTIAFLDTPGHAAFTAMRARGATVTDLVVLIVAADDGVMPQTKEAIDHAKSAKVPILVAVNKIDKPGVDPEKIMRDLAAEGLQPEDWGGDTIFCRISAKTGEGVDNLLDMLALQAEMLELKAYPQRRASGVVVEALLDRGRGPVARVLVQDGTLRRGDVLLAGAAYGKIRAMMDEKGRQLAEAGPATPVEVLGLNAVPAAGDPVHAVKDPKAAESIASERRTRINKNTAVQDTRVSLEALTNRLSEEEAFELNVIIKADVQGSVEALQQALTKLSTDRVKLSVVLTGVGGITENDVNLATAGKAIIIGFNVRPAGKAKKAAEGEGVEIRLYDVIYECIDDVRRAMEGLLPAKEVEKDLGRAEVREVFRITKVGAVAGCMVIDGLMRRGTEARLVRDDVVVWTGKLGSVRRFKDDVREVKEGFECGLTLEGYGDLKQGDIIECFEIEQVKATL
jgi:translation initiation factor IF-2